jgi:hypothetical protein
VLLDCFFTVTPKVKTAERCKEHLTVLRNATLYVTNVQTEQQPFQYTGFISFNDPVIKRHVNGVVTL